MQCLTGLHWFWCRNGIQNPCKWLEAGWPKTEIETTQIGNAKTSSCISGMRKPNSKGTKSQCTQQWQQQKRNQPQALTTTEMKPKPSMKTTKWKWTMAHSDHSKVEANQVPRASCWQHIMELQSHWLGAFHPRDSNQSSNLKMQNSTRSSTSYPIHQADTRPSPWLHWTTNTSHKPCQIIHL